MFTRTYLYKTVWVLLVIAFIGVSGMFLVGQTDGLWQWSQIGLLSIDTIFCAVTLWFSPFIQTETGALYIRRSLQRNLLFSLTMIGVAISVIMFSSIIQSDPTPDLLALYVLISANMFKFLYIAEVLLFVSSLHDLYRVNMQAK